MRERTVLIVRYRLVAPPAGAKAPAAFPPELQAVLTRAVKDLIGGYYSYPAGWATVGYDTFPGRCGDLMRYTRPEG